MYTCTVLRSSPLPPSLPPFHSPLPLLLLSPISPDCLLSRGEGCSGVWGPGLDHNAPLRIPGQGESGMGTPLVVLMCVCIMYMYMYAFLILIWVCTCTYTINTHLNILRLQLYSILKSDWSGAWLLLPIVTRTVNSIVSAGYSRKIVLMRVKWNLFSKSCSF